VAKLEDEFPFHNFQANIMAGPKRVWMPSERRLECEKNRPACLLMLMSTRLRASSPYLNSNWSPKKEDDERVIIRPKTTG